MTLRTSLKRLVGRDTPAQTLRERAATVRAGIAATKPSTDVTAAADPLPQADPVLTAIEAVRGCLRVCKAAQRLPQPPGRLDPLPEQEAAGEALHASLDVLAQTVPATAQGCAALAQFAVEFHAAEDFAIDEDERGQQHLRILNLIARSPALVEGAQRERTPVPMEADALTTAILYLWPLWAAQPSDEGSPGAAAAYEDLQRRRFALIDAAAGLPATSQAIVPKALALAWLHYVEEWRAKQERGEYQIDGRLALDIHAAAIAPRLQTNPPRATYGIAERVDFDAITLDELRTIHEKMRHLSSTAYALASQGCCRSGDRNPFGNPPQRRRGTAALDR